MKKYYGTIAIAALLLSLASCRTGEQENPNSVSVSGIGTVQARPDMAELSIRFSQVSKTTKEAKAGVEATLLQVLDLLQAEKAEPQDIRTQTLNYGVEYEWRGGRRIRMGQRAEQSLVVKVKDLVNWPERLSAILDRLVAVDKVEVQDIRFDIDQKADLYRQSRELAFQKASEKARQYAELSGRKLGKVLMLREGYSRDVAQNQSLIYNVAAESKEYFAADESVVPAGEQGVTSEVEIVFALD